MDNFNQFTEFNRFQNLDSIATKVVGKLVDSTSKHGNMLWKILKYDQINALSSQFADLTKAEREDLIFHDNGQATSKRVFFAPFIDDAWQEQCSSLYVYVDGVRPVDHIRSVYSVMVEVVVHSKISTINGDGDPFTNPLANPNDSDEEGNIVVAFKNRATVLLKCVLAELNGSYLDDIGYLQLNSRLLTESGVKCNLWNDRAFWGYQAKFAVLSSGASQSPTESR